MKNRTLKSTFPNIVVLLICLISSTACDLAEWNLKEANFPEVMTVPEVELGDKPTEIRISGSITGLLEGISVDQHGHLWSSTIDQPTLEDEVNRSRFNRLNNGSFSSTIPELTPGQEIHFRAYAIFAEEVFYGAVQSFTPDELDFQIVTDTAIQIIQSNAPISEVRIQSSIANLPLGVNIKRLGLCWALDPEPTIEDNLTIDGLDILNVDNNVSYQSKLSNLSVGRYYVRSYAQIGEKIYYGNNLCFNWGDFWIQLRKFPARDRSNVFSFSVNGKGYVGGGGSRPSMGPNFNVSFNDCWSFDPLDNKWSRLADTPGELAYYGQKSFIVNNRAFLGFGDNSSSFEDKFYSDFWEYDLEMDQWIARDTFPPGARGRVTAFAVNGFIYAGMGQDEDGLQYQDFWQYDPMSDQWTRKEDFPGGPRAGAQSFVIGEKAYFLDESDFWEYTPGSDKWTQKNYPPALINSYPIYLFTLQERAYIYTNSNMWEYDSKKEQWISRSNLPRTYPSVHFSIDDIGYIGLDLWAYYPLEECE